jgi:hypothetical protein
MAFFCLMFSPILAHTWRDGKEFRDFQQEFRDFQRWGNVVQYGREQAARGCLGKKSPFGRPNFDHLSIKDVHDFDSVVHQASCVSAVGVQYRVFRFSAQTSQQK